MNRANEDMKVGTNVIFVMAFDIGLKIPRRENEEQEKAPERGRDVKNEAQKGPSKTWREPMGRGCVVVQGSNPYVSLSWLSRGRQFSCQFSLNKNTDNPRKQYQKAIIEVAIRRIKNVRQ